MFVAGTSTHKVGEVAQTLMGIAPSASTISRLNQSLTHQFETWRQRPLQAHWRVVYLDGFHFRIRHADQADATIILTALAVDLEGNKEVLALRACAHEGQPRSISSSPMDTRACSLLSANSLRQPHANAASSTSNATS